MYVPIGTCTFSSPFEVIVRISDSSSIVCSFFWFRFRDFESVFVVLLRCFRDEACGSFAFFPFQSFSTRFEYYKVKFEISLGCFRAFSKSLQSGILRLLISFWNLISRTLKFR